MTIDEAKDWLRKLGTKYLGDGICKSVRASEILKAIEDAELEEEMRRKDIDDDHRFENF